MIRPDQDTYVHAQPATGEPSRLMLTSARATPRRHQRNFPDGSRYVHRPQFLRTGIFSHLTDFPPHPPRATQRSNTPPARINPITPSRNADHEGANTIRRINAAAISDHDDLAALVGWQASSEAHQRLSHCRPPNLCEIDQQNLPKSQHRAGFGNVRKIMDNRRPDFSR